MGFKVCRALWKLIHDSALLIRESRYGRSLLYVCLSASALPGALQVGIWGQQGGDLRLCQCYYSEFEGLTWSGFSFVPSPVLSSLLWKLNKTVENTCPISFQNCGFLMQTYFIGLLLLFLVFCSRHKQTPFIFHKVIQQANSWTHTWVEIWHL